MQYCNEKVGVVVYCVVVTQNEAGQKNYLNHSITLKRQWVRQKGGIDLQLIQNCKNLVIYTSKVHCQQNDSLFLSYEAKN